MKVFLPSHGLFGQKVIKLRIPTFGDLREIQNFNNDELLKKYEFVQMLSNVDLNKVTAMDIDYLFQVISFSLMFNLAKFKVTCDSCKEEFETKVNIVDQDIKELQKIKLPFHKRINGTKYTYTILKASQMLEAYQWAIYKDNVEEAFEDAQALLIMGKTLNDMSYIKKLPIPVYLGAFLFQRINYHGLDFVAEAVCPKCGNKFKYNFSLSTKTLEFSVHDMMARFYSMSRCVSFSDFLKLSIVDYNALVENINSSLQ